MTPDMGTHIRHHSQVMGDKDHADIHLFLKRTDGTQNLILDDDV
jgi:hypothetical protein